MIPYEPPVFGRDHFNCPFCNAYAHQIWSDDVSYLLKGEGNYGASDIKVVMCSHCNEIEIWYKGKSIYPLTSLGPFPNPDLPDEIKEDYEEARAIISLSPRGSAALLRLSIQKLCIVLGEKGKDIFLDIGNLVKKGLPVVVKEALDIVRVIGNEAVHPGQLDIKDDIETAKILFELVNIIAEKMITEPKKIKELHDKLPETKKNAIEKRDGT